MTPVVAPAYDEAELPEADYRDGEHTPPGASTPEEVAVAPISGQVARTRSASSRAARSTSRPAPPVPTAIPAAAVS
eukprot:12244407-Prorocentrum_lima.AAC.1